MGGRRRPLQTCGNSFVATGQRAYARAQEFDGPSGSMFKGMTRLAPLASPLIQVIQNLALACLSLADTQILAAEDVMEKVFPPSSYAFDQIDQLVQLTEHLPDKVDAIVEKVPQLIHQIPFLEWMLGLIVSWINFWIYKLVPVEEENVREKDILVDASYNEGYLKSECNNEADDPIIDSPKKTCGDDNMGESSPIPETQKPDSEHVPIPMSPGTGVGMKGTYKEALEKGKKEAQEEVKEEGKNAVTTDDKGDHGKDEDKSSVSDDFIKNDPLLALFESGWALSPKRKN